MFARLQNEYYVEDACLPACQVSVIHMDKPAPA
jgi:hypothetical protein